MSGLAVYLTAEGAAGRMNQSSSAICTALRRRRPVQAAKAAVDVVHVIVVVVVTVVVVEVVENV